MRVRCIVVYTTFPNARVARKLVQALVQRKYAACGSIFKLFSIYRWQGRIERSGEYGALIKTTRGKYRTVEQYIREEHPYEVPQIVAWEIDRGLPAYLDWVRKATDRRPADP